MITQKVIKYLIDNKVATKDELATYLNVTPNGIINYKNGKYEMSPTKLVDLCEEYSMNVHDFNKKSE